MQIYNVMAKSCKHSFPIFRSNLHCVSKMKSRQKIRIKKRWNLHFIIVVGMMLYVHQCIRIGHLSVNQNA